MTWTQAQTVARDLVQLHNDLPTVQWCRLNGYGRLTTAVHGNGHTWEDMRIAIGLPSTKMRGGRPRYFNSRSGVRWRSRPEACLSDFLYARGIEHKRGERYPDDYAAQSGRTYGRYDLHFKSIAGAQIDVEIWGDIPDAFSHGRYGVTRKMKEAYHAGRENFLGVGYLDCLSESRLEALLKPYIGSIKAFQFEKPQDRIIESAHWSNADELLESCRQLAASAPGGIFPSDEWLRKRGRYADRPGETFNTLSERVNSWLGGTRNVRELLGQAEASTKKWTDESVVAAWQEFECEHGLTPAQCKGSYRKGVADQEIFAEGARIYEVARRLGVIDKARVGRTRRKVKWTREITIQEWRDFCSKTGRTPSQCMSNAQRKALPKSITDKATRIYGAATRLGLLEELRRQTDF